MGALGGDWVRGLSRECQRLSYKKPAPADTRVQTAVPVVIQQEILTTGCTHAGTMPRDRTAPDPQAKCASVCLLSCFLVLEMEPRALHTSDACSTT